MRTEPYQMTVTVKLLANGNKEMHARIVDDNLMPTEITRYMLGDQYYRAIVDEMRFGDERFNMLDHIGNIEAVNAWVGARLNKTASV